MGFRVQIWSGGALWNPLSFLIKDSIQSNLWTGKESSLLKIQLVKNINDEKDLCFSRMIFEEQESTVDITVKNDRVTAIEYYQ